MIRRLTACAVGGALALTGLAAGTAQAAATDILKQPFDDALYQVVEDVDGDFDLAQLTAEEWEALGYPAYANVPTAYTKVSWSPVLYGVSDWPTAVDQYDGVPTPLTPEQWASVGNPGPMVDDLGLLFFLKFSTSSEVFGASPVGEFKKYSFGEWAALGHPAPEPQDGGFGKLTWDDSIAFFTDVEAGEADGVLEFEDWKDFAFPTPTSQKRFAGDRFYFESATSEVVLYEGPTYEGPITYEQWDAAGFPEPEPAGTPVDPDPAPPAPEPGSFVAPGMRP